MAISRRESPRSVECTASFRNNLTYLLSYLLSSFVGGSMYSGKRNATTRWVEFADYFAEFAENGDSARWCRVTGDGSEDCRQRCTSTLRKARSGQTRPQILLEEVSDTFRIFFSRSAHPVLNNWVSSGDVDSTAWAVSVHAAAKELFQQLPYGAQTDRLPNEF